jgi:hypothetical protein
MATAPATPATAAAPARARTVLRHRPPRTQSNTWARVAFSVRSGESKRKWADDDSVAYGDATQLPVGSIKRRENDEHAAPQPQKLSTHFFFVFTLCLSDLIMLCP